MVKSIIQIAPKKNPLKLFDACYHHGMTMWAKISNQQSSYQQNSEQMYRVVSLGSQLLIHCSKHWLLSFCKCSIATAAVKCGKSSMTKMQNDRSLTKEIVIGVGRGGRTWWMIQQGSSLFCEMPLFWHRQGCPPFENVHQAFSLPTMMSPRLQSALKVGFGEAAVAHEMLKPCKFPSLDSCQKRFL